MKKSDIPFSEKVDLIAGVDEVGRGPLAGDVVAAAVILDPDNPIEGLMDSKKLSHKKRVQLAAEIHQKAQSVAIGRASVTEIDEFNILKATMLAMSRAVAGLSVTPKHCLIDGNRIPPNLPCPADAIVKGDSKVEAISAASIVAKVQRDGEMDELDEQHPQYGFKRHKGYGTKEHLAAIADYGVIDQHRRSFAPVRNRLTTDS